MGTLSAFRARYKLPGCPNAQSTPMTASRDPSASSPPPLATQASPAARRALLAFALGFFFDGIGHSNVLIYSIIRHRLRSKQGERRERTTNDGARRNRSNF